MATTEPISLMLSVARLMLSFLTRDVPTLEYVAEMDIVVLLKRAEAPFVLTWHSSRTPYR